MGHSEAFQPDSDGIDLYDISWVMDGIDLGSVLDRLGVRITYQRGAWWWGYCPDHHLYVGREPSHAKWSINEDTGMTKCFTEPRVSNLVFTVARLKNISPYKAVEWILGYSVNSIEARACRLKKLMSPMGLVRKVDAFDIEKYKPYIEGGTLGSNSVALLARNNISSATAKDFNCIEMEDGYYAGRLICPVNDLEGEMQGFVATDTLGLEDWMKSNPIIVDRKSKRQRRVNENDYRKVLYPANFRVGNYLLGADTFKRGDIAILVEGCRDVMKLRQEGFSGSLGIGGTNLSDQQLLTLTRLAPKKLMIMLDGDEGGKMGARRITERCLPLFPEIFVINIVGGKDPKDLSREEILFHMRNHTERIYQDLKNAMM
jgi:hypothetical protein